MVTSTSNTPPSTPAMSGEPPKHTCIGFYRLSQVLELIPIGKSTWWVWVSDGRAPAPVKLSQSVTAWRKDEVHALIDKFANERASKIKEAANV